MRATAPLPFGWSDLDGPTEMAKVEALLVQMAGCLPRQTLVNWKIITTYDGYSSFPLQQLLQQLSQALSRKEPKSPPT